MKKHIYLILLILLSFSLINASTELEIYEKYTYEKSICDSLEKLINQEVQRDTIFYRKVMHYKEREKFGVKAPIENSVLIKNPLVQYLLQNWECFNIDCIYGAMAVETSTARLLQIRKLNKASKYAMKIDQDNLEKMINDPCIKYQECGEGYPLESLISKLDDIRKNYGVIDSITSSLITEIVLLLSQVKKEAYQDNFDKYDSIEFKLFFDEALDKLNAYKK